MSFGKHVGIDFMGKPAVEKPVASSRNSRSICKRAMDLMVAVPALLLLSPFMIVIAFLIKRRDGGPALFRQTRIGQNGQEFTCFKFRSMVMDANAELERVLRTDPEAAAEWARDQKLRKDPRITQIGRFIRKTSLDELPQLINIIRGDMSIVGPRPIVHNEVTKYGEYFSYYQNVKPGVTGLWQISGRNDTTYEERVALDVKYAQDWSIYNDISILAKTVPAVLFSRGAY